MLCCAANAVLPCTAELYIVVLGTVLCCTVLCYVLHVLHIVLLHHAVLCCAVLHALSTVALDTTVTLLVKFTAVTLCTSLHCDGCANL
jgi:hypothetical protein